jgi:hypothetical protein
VAAFGFFGVCIIGPTSSEEFVELIVRPDPRPGDRAARALADRPVLCPYADGPQIIEAVEFFETKRGMCGIFDEKAVSFASRAAARTAGSS